jgi:YD repeat-containing protein
MRLSGIVPLLAAAVLVTAAAASASDHQYMGAKGCRSCHVKQDIGNQYKRWQDSKHAKAFETLGSEQAKKWAAERGLGDPQTEDECVKCHVTGHGVEPARLARAFDKTMGVQCESCHGAGRDYRKKKIMVDQELAVSKGLVLQSPEVCLACHNDESPAWKPDRYTTTDGRKVGFDYDQAVRLIAHPVPEGYDPFATEPK